MPVIRGVAAALAVATGIGAQGGVARAQDAPAEPAADTWPHHRVMLDVLPYTSLLFQFGQGIDGESDGKVDGPVLLGGFAPRYEYAPLSWLAVGAGVGVRLLEPLVVLPEASVRFMLPLVDGHLEPFVMLQGGGAIIRREGTRGAPTYLGTGWTVSPSLGVQWLDEGRWGVGGHVAWRVARTTGEDDAYLDIPGGFEGVLTVLTWF